MSTISGVFHGSYMCLNVTLRLASKNDEPEAIHVVRLLRLRPHPYAVKSKVNIMSDQSISTHSMMLSANCARKKTRPRNQLAVQLTFHVGTAYLRKMLVQHFHRSVFRQILPFCQRSSIHNGKSMLTAQNKLLASYACKLAASSPGLSALIGARTFSSAAVA